VGEALVGEERDRVGERVCRVGTHLVGEVYIGGERSGGESAGRGEEIWWGKEMVGERDGGEKEIWWGKEIWWWWGIRNLVGERDLEEEI